MTQTERAVLSGELADFRAEMLTELRAIRQDVQNGQTTTNDKIAAVNARLDRQDGAFTFIKAAAGFLGVGGLGLILATIIEASGHGI